MVNCNKNFLTSFAQTYSKSRTKIVVFQKKIRISLTFILILVAFDFAEGFPVQVVATI